MINRKKRIAIFASGSGTNAENIAKYFNEKNTQVEVVLFLTNNQKAGIFDRGQILNIPVLKFTRSTFYDTNRIVDILQKLEIDLVVLAGFLWLIPQNLVEAFPQKIINIHPALLPKYGGKGMYGYFVHEAVWKNKESETGITIHFVNEKYDEGKPIFQISVQIDESDTPQTIAEKIHILEMDNFPKVIEALLNDQKNTEK